jgi:hypothetical protein
VFTPRETISGPERRVEYVSERERETVTDGSNCLMKSFIIILVERFMQRA